MIFPLSPIVLITNSVQVPAYYNQFERQAVIDSLHLAGLKELALVNDGTASMSCYFFHSAPVN